MTPHTRQLASRAWLSLLFDRSSSFVHDVKLFTHNYYLPGYLSISRLPCFSPFLHDRLRGVIRGHHMCSATFTSYQEEMTSELDSVDNPISINACMIKNILKSSVESKDMYLDLDKFVISLNEELVVQVLRKLSSEWKPALSFFNWASKQQSYVHGSRAYNEILNILGRMKQIKLMRQVFDEIPRHRIATVINEKTFSILLNRYASSHKVDDAISLFHKREEYGLKNDLVAFQILLMSLCRYKHVEEAEALFLQEQHRFPAVIRSRNIILNGWCVLGSLREAKRFWNNIISSSCKPDLFTYCSFINCLTKAGKLGAAIKLFTSMWNKGCNPDVAICNCIIDALCFKKKIPDALKIFGEMNERGLLADVATYNSLIKHLCHIRKMEKVYQLLDDMEQKGLVPNTKTYSYVLKTAKKTAEVTELLSRMERTNCRLDSDTYNLILNLYVRWNYQRGFLSIWDEMEACGLGPDQRSYTIMVHGLFHHGKLEEALRYFTEMKAKGMIPEPRTLVLVQAIHLKRDQSSKSSEIVRATL